MMATLLVGTGCVVAAIGAVLARISQRAAVALVAAAAALAFAAKFWLGGALMTAAAVALTRSGGPRCPRS